MIHTALLIRPANKDDVVTLLQFEQGLVEAERPHALDLQSGSVTYYDLDALLDSDAAQLLVAEQAGELVACGYIRIEPSKIYQRSDRHGYLGFMYVAPEYRGHGLNKLILDRLLQWGERHGIDTFKLEVYATNQPAIKAYEKAGFKANLVQMVLERAAT